MQRRVLLARAFSSQPDILLLDETFHGLSEEDHDAMLRALQREVHLIPALVWVTHEKKSAPNWLNNAIDL
jgi:ABC-type molybdenum transport system ATPase subunit/photorepair protein PhrA